MWRCTVPYICMFSVYAFLASDMRSWRKIAPVQVTIFKVIQHTKNDTMTRQGGSCDCISLDRCVSYIIVIVIVPTIKWVYCVMLPPFLSLFFPACVCYARVHQFLMICIAVPRAVRQLSSYSGALLSSVASIMACVIIVYMFIYEVHGR